MMKSAIAAAAIVAFGATSAAAACGWKAKQDTIADLDVKTKQQQTVQQSNPVETTGDGDRGSERLQLAVDPRTDDDANN
jgi:outer membrane lipopolysaccharide assembly protein LptE/RlpB